MKRRHLTLIEGGRRDEDRARVNLWPYDRRVVRAEPRPVPTPRPSDPRPAA